MRSWWRSYFRRMHLVRHYLGWTVNHGKICRICGWYALNILGCRKVCSFLPCMPFSTIQPISLASILSAHFSGGYSVKYIPSSSWKTFRWSEKSNCFERRVSEYRKSSAGCDPASVHVFTRDADFWHKRVAHSVGVQFEFGYFFIMSNKAILSFKWIDGAGNTTRLHLVKEYFHRTGFSIKCSAFPQRKISTPLSNVLVNYLKGDRTLDAESAQLIFAADQYSAKDDTKRSLDASVLVLIGRYIASGITYRKANGLPRQWCEAIESRLITPDLTIFLDITPELA